jgi:transcriptional regulator with XRE-family HTH domain
MEKQPIELSFPTTTRKEFTMKIDYKAFKRAREARMLSIGELARKSGISPKTIWTMERRNSSKDAYSPPRFQTLRKLIEALGYSIKDNPFITKD